MRPDLNLEMSEQERSKHKETLDRITDFATAAAKRMNQPLEEIRRRIQDNQRKEYINRSHFLYERTGNPLFAWDTFKSCQEWNLPVPEWVKEYLIQTADILMSFTYDGWPEGTRPAKFIPQALGLSDGQGSRSIFTQYTTAQKKLDIYLTVKDVERELASGLKKTRGQSKFSLAGQRLGMSAEYAREIYYEERKFFKMGVEM